jgi:hypothetical protein
MQRENHQRRRARFVAELVHSMRLQVIDGLFPESAPDELAQFLASLLDRHQYRVVEPPPMVHCQPDEIARQVEGYLAHCRGTVKLAEILNHLQLPHTHRERLRVAAVLRASRWQRCRESAGARDRYYASPSCRA